MESAAAPPHFCHSLPMMPTKTGSASGAVNATAGRTQRRNGEQVRRSLSAEKKGNTRASKTPKPNLPGESGTVHMPRPEIATPATKPPTKHSAFEMTSELVIWVRMGTRLTTRAQPRMVRPQIMLETVTHTDSSLRASPTPARMRRSRLKRKHTMRDAPRSSLPVEVGERRNR